jgi:hypothetical protein
VDPKEYVRLSTLYAERVLERDQRDPGFTTTWENLSALVLANGGELVVPGDIDHAFLHYLLRRGAHVSGPATRAPGDPNRCHDNAIALWESGECTGIGTGYALSADGLWRHHSWGQTSTTFFETTVQREAYFGVVLTGDVAEAFAQDDLA